ncbi:hypothetical protein F5I97DRAFT_700502 [Phlebopus sp. FC_14]|nr:hypothetical protein F5I97DRAFT_700502 [Phlebopus sp. FC_14]
MSQLLCCSGDFDLMETSRRRCLPRGLLTPCDFSLDHTSYRTEEGIIASMPCEMGYLVLCMTRVTRYVWWRRNDYLPSSRSHGEPFVFQHWDFGEEETKPSSGCTSRSAIFDDAFSVGSGGGQGGKELRYYLPLRLADVTRSLLTRVSWPHDRPHVDKWPSPSMTLLQCGDHQLAKRHLPGHCPIMRLSRPSYIRSLSCRCTDYLSKPSLLSQTVRMEQHTNDTLIQALRPLAWVSADVKYCPKTGKTNSSALHYRTVSLLSILLGVYAPINSRIIAMSPGSPCSCWNMCNPECFGFDPLFEVLRWIPSPSKI